MSVPTTTSPQGRPAPVPPFPDALRPWALIPADPARIAVDAFATTNSTFRPGSVKATTKAA
jgi:hypothetical protein